MCMLLDATMTKSIYCKYIRIWRKDHLVHRAVSSFQVIILLLILLTLPDHPEALLLRINPLYRSIPELTVHLNNKTSKQTEISQIAFRKTNILRRCPAQKSPVRPLLNPLAPFPSSLSSSSSALLPPVKTKASGSRPSSIRACPDLITCEYSSDDSRTKRDGSMVCIGGEREKNVSVAMVTAKLSHQWIIGDAEYRSCCRCCYCKERRWNKLKTSTMTGVVYGGGGGRRRRRHRSKSEGVIDWGN